MPPRLTDENIANQDNRNKARGNDVRDRANEFDNLVGGGTGGGGGGGNAGRAGKTSTKPPGKETSPNGVKGERGADGVWRPDNPNDPKLRKNGGGRLPGQSDGKKKKKKNKAGDNGPPDPNSDTEVSNMIRDTAMRVARGEEGSFSPKRVEDMKDQLFSATIGRVKHDVRALDASAVRRGMFRSGIAQRGEADLRRNALNAYSSGVKDIMIKKMEAEFKDKMTGMGLAQNWLNQKQNYELGKERNQIARAQISATTAASQLSAKVGMASIAAANGRARASLAHDRAKFISAQSSAAGKTFN